MFTASVRDRSSPQTRAPQLDYPKVPRAAVAELDAGCPICIGWRAAALPIRLTKTVAIQKASEHEEFDVTEPTASRNCLDAPLSPQPKKRLISGCLKERMLRVKVNWLENHASPAALPN